MHAGTTPSLVPGNPFIVPNPPPEYLPYAEFRPLPPADEKTHELLGKILEELQQLTKLIKEKLSV